MSDLSAYVHVPYCRRKCNYCSFYSTPPISGELSQYTESLCNQIRTSSYAGRALKTVYVGGGTPSLLSASDFRRIFSAFEDAFDLSSCEEITVECNPESITEALGETLLECGVNRISMGIQTFSPSALQLLGRLHSAEQGEAAYKMLRKVGFSNLSLDLMIALPGQTESDVAADLNRMIALSPEHLSVYLLSVDPDSAFGAMHVSEADEEVQRALYLLTHRTLTAAGYDHYEISNFARPGARALHNSRYWQGKEYLAFGPGAAGFVDGVRYRIPADRDAFCRLRGMVSPIVEDVLSAEGRQREAVFLGLRCSDGIPNSLISADKKPILERLLFDGLAIRKGDRISLTAEGFLVSDGIIGMLLD